MYFDLNFAEMPVFVEKDAFVPNMKQTITRGNNDFVCWHIYGAQRRWVKSCLVRVVNILIFQMNSAKIKKIYINLVNIAPEKDSV